MQGKLKRGLLFSLFFFFTTELFCQSIRICDRHYQSQSAFDAETGMLYFLANDSLKIVNVKDFRLVHEELLPLPEGMESVQLVPVCLDHHLYFVHNLGGQVFKYEQGNLRRIDRSFTHKMQMNSSIFAHNGHLFRYGGYGFWSFRNFFTYFDPETREWEILEPTGSTRFPPGSSYGTIVKILGDEWHVFGGQTLDQQSPLEYRYNDQCWVFNKSHRKWIYKGRLQQEISRPCITHAEYGDKVVVVYQAKTFVLDLRGNRMKEYRNSVPGNSIRAIPDNYITSYFYEGNFLILAASSSDANVSLTRVGESEFLKDFKGESPIYKTGPNWLLTGFILALVPILIFLYVRRKRRVETVDKITLSDGKIACNSREMRLEKEQFELLALFLRSEELTTNDLLEFLGQEQLHYSQNIRTINNLVEEVNIQVGLLLQMEVKVIQKQKSAIDKRIKVYSLQKRYFNGFHS